MEDLQNIGVAAIVALLIIREVFNFLKSKNGNGNGNGTTKHLAFESSKVMGALDTELRKLNHGVSNLSQLITILTHHVKESRSDIKELKEEVKK